MLIAAGPLPLPAPAVAGSATAIAVADFDYHDTSGEVANQATQHAERMQLFGRLLRDELAGQANLKVVRLDCGQPECSVSSLGADGLIAAARHAGVRLLVYGGIHKMSSLIQWGEVEVVDLQQDKLLLQRNFTFRGDTDLAYRQAAAFVGQSLRDITPKP